MRLRPVHDLVIIKQHDAPMRTKGVVGEVLAVGPGRLTDHGAMIVPTVKAGEVVVMRRFSGHLVTVDGEEYLVVSAGEILSVIEGAGAS